MGARAIGRDGAGMFQWWLHKAQQKTRGSERKGKWGFTVVDGGQISVTTRSATGLRSVAPSPSGGRLAHPLGPGRPVDRSHHRHLAAQLDSPLLYRALINDALPQR